LWSCDNSCTSPLTLAMARESPLLACDKSKSPVKIARLQHTVVLVLTARTQPIILTELGHVISALNCMGVLIPGQARSLFCSYMVTVYLMVPVMNLTTTTPHLSRAINLQTIDTYTSVHTNCSHWEITDKPQEVHTHHGHLCHSAGQQVK